MSDYPRLMLIALSLEHEIIVPKPASSAHGADRGSGELDQLFDRFQQTTSLLEASALAIKAACIYGTQKCCLHEDQSINLVSRPNYLTTSSITSYPDLEALQSSINTSVLRVPMPTAFFDLVMAFGIKFIPLTPGGHPQPSPVSPTPVKDTDAKNLKQLEFELYKNELIALRERDMAITSPTRPEYFARHQSSVQIAFPSAWPDVHDFDYGYDVLIDPYSDYDMSVCASPTGIGCDAWDTSVPDASYLLDVDDFLQYQSLHPEDITTASDLWDSYQSAMESYTEDMISIDDVFLTSAEEDFNLDFTIANPPTSDTESVTSSIPSDPSITPTQDC